MMAAFDHRGAASDLREINAPGAASRPGCADTHQLLAVFVRLFKIKEEQWATSEPFSWQALKRLLRQQEIRIEDVTRFVGLELGLIGARPHSA
jgi:hypothetical protein